MFQTSLKTKLRRHYNILLLIGLMDIHACMRATDSANSTGGGQRRDADAVSEHKRNGVKNQWAN